MTILVGTCESEIVVRIESQIESAVMIRLRIESRIESGCSRLRVQCADSPGSSNNIT